MLSIRLDTSQVRTSGLLDGEAFFQKLHKAVGRAMRAESKVIQAAVRSNVSGQLKVVKKSFLKGFGAKVLDQDRNRLPGMVIRSRIPWAGMHEYGGTISGKMLIPINGRVGRKRFKAYVDELMRGGNAYFIKKNGKVILMAENIKEHDRPLAGFKRRFRKAEGIKRLKRGADIPIAVLVSKVTLRKRIDVEGVVQRRIPMLCAAIDKEIATMSKA
jgi:hypothetical protein